MNDKSSAVKVFLPYVKPSAVKPYLKVKSSTVKVSPRVVKPRAMKPCVSYKAVKPCNVESSAVKVLPGVVMSSVVVLNAVKRLPSAVSRAVEYEMTRAEKPRQLP